MKKKMNRTVLVTLRLPREMAKGLDLLCLQRERYRSEVMVEAIAQYLEKDRALEASGRSQVEKRTA